MPTPEQPLIAKNSTAATVAGGSAAAIVAALGWLATELVDIEKKVSAASERVELTLQSVEDRIGDIDDDVDELQKAFAVLEAATFKMVEREREQK